MKKENLEKLKKIQESMQSSIEAKYGGEVLQHNLPFDVKEILDILIDEASQSE